MKQHKNWRLTATKDSRVHLVKPVDVVLTVVKPAPQAVQDSEGGAPPVLNVPRTQGAQPPAPSLP